MISYGSAIAATPARCVRTLDPGAVLGQAMLVCGAPVAGGPGLRARYCAEHHRELTAPLRSQPRLPRGPIADDWVMPTEAELTEAFG